ncbi:MAG TPA: AbrB/MazE/SpoVT family DNA-binding domain-containing protein [Fimbriimonas sp.]
MQLTVDNFGRVVLPKEVRDRLGLTPKSRLTLIEERGGIRLEPVDSTSQVVRGHEGILVLRGKLR